MMIEEPQSIGAAEDDADYELTQLEWDASQRSLSLDEQERLNKLRHQRREVTNDMIDRVSLPEPETGNTVISGDDST